MVTSKPAKRARIIHALRDLPANLNIYVADTDNCRVMQWEAKARFGVPIAGGTGGGAAMDQLLSPRAIALSPDGKWIYVVDPGNNRIQQWSSASS